MEAFVFETFFFFFPAWITNMLFVIVGALASALRVPDVPIDFSKNFFDGRRLLGDNRNVGVACVGLIIGIAAGYLVVGDFSVSIFGAGGAFLGHTLLGSFVKRRLGLPSGYKFPLLDRIDATACAAILLFLFADMPLRHAIFGIALALTFHPLISFLGYTLKMKKNPW